MQKRFLGDALMCWPVENLTLVTDQTRLSPRWMKGAERAVGI